jgi:hypothetical protein
MAKEAVARPQNQRDRADDNEDGERSPSHCAGLRKHSREQAGRYLRESKHAEHQNGG